MPDLTTPSASNKFATGTAITVRDLRKTYVVPEREGGGDKPRPSQDA